MSLVDPVLWPFIQTSHQSVLGRSGDTVEEGGKPCLEVAPSELRVMAVGLDALGFEWHVAGLAPGQALGWPERHVPARARALSSRWDITYEAYFMPSTVASLTWMSCQCHWFLLNLELSSSWELGASAWRQDIAYQHLGSLGGWFSKLLLSCYPKDFIWERKKEMLCTPLPKECWFLGHQVK